MRDTIDFYLDDWLDVAALTDAAGIDGDEGQQEPAQAFARGKLAAMRYFFAYELPRLPPWLAVVRREPLVREMRDEWF